MDFDLAGPKELFIAPSSNTQRAVCRAPFEVRGLVVARNLLDNVWRQKLEANNPAHVTFADPRVADVDR